MAGFLSYSIVLFHIIYPIKYLLPLKNMHLFPLSSDAPVFMPVGIHALITWDTNLL